MDRIDENIASFFTKGSHHRNISVILITQNLFHQNSHFRTIKRNSQYLILFKNPRDTQQIEILDRQLSKRNRLKEAYIHATSRHHGYLMLDLRQITPEKYSLRTWVLRDHPQGFPNQTVYYPSSLL